MDRRLETKQLDQTKRFQTGVEQRFDGANRRVATANQSQMGKKHLKTPLVARDESFPLQTYVAGHSSNKGNDEADRLAKAGAAKS